MYEQGNQYGGSNNGRGYATGNGYGNGHKQSQQMPNDPMSIYLQHNNPMLRMQDVPGADLLCVSRMLHPDDPDLRGLHEQVEQDQLWRAVLAGDPYWANYPPEGALPELRDGRIPLASLPTGDVLSIPIQGATKNILIVGPTGHGKTNALRIILASLLRVS